MKQNYYIILFTKKKGGEKKTQHAVSASLLRSKGKRATLRQKNRHNAFKLRKVNRNTKKMQN